jgi:hypothetical protein
MLNTGNRHRCPNCFRQTTVDYLLRLHKCDKCSEIFYYNSLEHEPFPRELLSRHTAEQREDLYRKQNSLSSKYRDASSQHKKKLNKTDRDFDQIQINNRVLIFTVVFQILSGLFLLKYVNLHNLAEPASLLLLSLFTLTVILIWLQFRESRTVRSKRRKLIEAFNSTYLDFAETIKDIDLKIVATSYFARNAHEKK